MKASKINLYLVLFLFLSGCGAVGTGLGIMLSQSDSSSSTNAVPSLSVSSPAEDTENNDLITISFKLIDNESNPANLMVEWSTDSGNTWVMATELPGETVDTESDGVVDLETSPTGEEHNFVWNSWRDLPGANLRDVQIRLTPIDSTTGLEGEKETLELDVMNLYVTSIMGRLDFSDRKLPNQPLFLWYDFVNQNKVYFTNATTNILSSLNLTDGEVEREVGTGLTPFNGDNQLGTLTNLSGPAQMDVFATVQTGELALAFADSFNHRLRIYNLTTRFASTIAGVGEPGYDEDFTVNAFNDPSTLKLDTPHAISVMFSTSGQFQGMGVYEKGNRVVRFLNYSTDSHTFYSGATENVGLALPLGLSITVKGNEMRTIAGNAFLPPRVVDGFIWVKKNPSFTTQGRFANVESIRIVRTPDGEKVPLLFAADTNRIRVVNLASDPGDGSHDVEFFASPPSGETSVTVKPGFMETLLGRPSLLGTSTTIGLKEGAYAPNSFLLGRVEDVALARNPNDNSLYDIYFSESSQHSIWKIDGQSGKLVRMVGNGQFDETRSGDGQDRKSVPMALPKGIAFHTSAMLITEQFSNRIRAVNFTTQTVTLAGKNIDSGKIDTLVSGPVLDTSSLVEPVEIAVDSSQEEAYICDRSASRILKHNLKDRTSEVFAGNGIAASKGDGGEAKNASIGLPSGLALYEGGGRKVLLVCDNGNFSSAPSGNVRVEGRIRIINLASSNLDWDHVTGLQEGHIENLVGGGSKGVEEAGGPYGPEQVRLGEVLDVFVDTPDSGRLPGVYIVDFLEAANTYRLLVYNPNTSYDYKLYINGGNVTINSQTVGVIAKSGSSGGPDNFTNPLDIKRFSEPGRSVASGGARNAANDTSLVVILPLVDNHYILGINYTNGTSGLQEVINVPISPGTGTRLVGEINRAGYNGDLKQGVNTHLDTPKGIFYISGAGGGSEVLAIADSGNDRIRIVFGNNAPPGVVPGAVNTIIGTGQSGYNGETLPAINTLLNGPTHLTAFPITNAKNGGATVVLVCDGSNKRIRRLAFED